MQLHSGLDPAWAIIEHVAETLIAQVRKDGAVASVAFCVVDVERYVHTVDGDAIVGIKRGAGLALIEH